MSQQKLVLEGVVTEGIAVKTADGELTKGTWVKMTADNEIGVLTANYDAAVGMLIKENEETSGKAVVLTRFQQIKTATSGAAYPVGALLMFNSASKLVKAKAVRASGTITVVDYSLIDSGDTVTVNGVALTAGGTDFSAATSNTVTALNIATAINNKVAGVKASVAPSAEVVVITALDDGQAGNDIALATSMEAGEATVSGAFLTGGKDLVAVGMALEAASAADQSKSVGFY